MSEPKTDSFLSRYGNLLIITVAIVLVVAAALWFLDRQQARDIELRRLDQQTDILEKWPPPRQNPQPANSPGGKVL